MSASSVTSASSGPSTMTRNAGSVPEGRTQHPAGLPESATGVGDRRLQHAIAFPLILVTRLDGPLLLRQHLDLRREIGERASGTGHHPKDLHGRDDAVARRRVLADDHVAALLPARAQLPETCMPSRMYLSPTGVRTTCPPAASTADCRPPFESTETTRPPPGRASRPRRSRARIPSTWSPSTTVPLCIDRNQPVRIAVEGEADVRATLDHGARE